MAFKNTVETVGDAALIRSIIDKSITELNCNITTSIRQQAFRACAALASVNFPNATSVALGAFWQCTALKKAEFASAVAFANNAFYGCSALTALILRNTEQISTITGTPFAASAIASGTGYIYVPAALVDTYKAASGWSTYASQIRAIEDYPGIGDPYSWAGVAANIANGSYASVYKVGDTIDLDLGTEGVVDMEVVGIDIDTLADGSGKAPISWLCKKTPKTKHRMNPAYIKLDDGTYQESTGAIGGWEKCEMRAYLNNTILLLIPESVRNLIKPVIKYGTMTSTSDVDTKNYETIDAIWIPGHKEFAPGSMLVTKGPTYAPISSINKGWYTREPFSYAKFYYVTSSNSTGQSSSNNEYDVRFGFCT